MWGLEGLRLLEALGCRVVGSRALYPIPHPYPASMFLTEGRSGVARVSGSGVRANQSCLTGELLGLV